jgi:hypothetical protein
MWAGSAMFAAYVQHCVVMDPAVRATWGGGTTTRFKFAMFHSAVTPDRLAPDAETFYDTGVWTAAEELAGGTWPAGGIAGAATVRTSNPVGGNTSLDCPLITRTGVTVTDLAGDLFYDGTTRRGLGFHDFGGAINVSGTLTITWAYPPGCVCLNVAPPGARQVRRR